MSKCCLLRLTLVFPSYSLQLGGISSISSTSLFSSWITIILKLSILLLISSSFFSFPFLFSYLFLDIFISIYLSVLIFSIFIHIASVFLLHNVYPLFLFWYFPPKLIFLGLFISWLNVFFIVLNIDTIIVLNASSKDYRDLMSLGISLGIYYVSISVCFFPSILNVTFMVNPYLK